MDIFYLLRSKGASNFGRKNQIATKFKKDYIFCPVWSIMEVQKVQIAFCTGKEQKKEGVHRNEDRSARRRNSPD